MADNWLDGWGDDDPPKKGKGSTSATELQKRLSQALSKLPGAAPARADATRAPRAPAPRPRPTIGADRSTTAQRAARVRIPTDRRGNEVGTTVGTEGFGLGDAVQGILRGDSAGSMAAGFNPFVEAAQMGAALRGAVKEHGVLSAPTGATLAMSALGAAMPGGEGGKLAREAGEAAAAAAPRIRAAAIRTADGKVYEGVSHWPAVEAASHAGSLPPVGSYEFDRAGWDDGFVDEGGAFLTRGQAAQRMRELGMPVRHRTDGLATASEDIRAAQRAADNALPFRERSDAAATLARLADENGGFTVNPITGESAPGGFSVGLGRVGGKAVASDSPSAADIQRMVAENPSYFDGSNPRIHIGGWKGESDGKYWFEPSEVFDTEEEALAAAKARNEDAIYDLNNFEEVFLKPHKASAGARIAPEEFRIGAEAGDGPPSPVITVGATASPPTAPAPAPGPSLPPQVDLPRYIPRNISAERLAEIEDEFFKTYNGRQFKEWLRAGGNEAWYNTTGTQQKAIDALGDAEGPSAFNRLMEMMGAVTARSDPANNLRRGGYYYGLDRAGLLDLDALRAGAYKAVPKGMGHLANNAHHAGLARLLEEGHIDSFSNPKPAGFVANLKRNFKPYTHDTRMAVGAHLANPRLAQLGALRVGANPGEVSPVKWAYAPSERAAQRAAKLAARRGDLGDLPAGASPTAYWQAKLWDGLGGVLPGASPNMGLFDDIFDKKLTDNARRWQLSPSEANQRFWEGHPLDLPLGADVIPPGLLGLFGQQKP